MGSGVEGQAFFAGQREADLEGREEVCWVYRSLSMRAITRSGVTMCQIFQYKTRFDLRPHKGSIDENGGRYF
jgi:hypothetical protein